jgi:hypothetical protein
MVLGYSRELHSRLTLPVASHQATEMPPQDLMLTSKTSIYQ